MEALLKRNRHTLALLKDAGPTRRRAILATLTPREVIDICEIVLNTISPDGAFPLPAERAASCRRHRATLRKLAFNKRQAWRVKRRLIQRGGGAWLVPILTTLLSGVADLFG